MPDNYGQVVAGDYWQRPNGTRFRIDYVDKSMGRVRYWLDEGNKTEFRYIDIDNLLLRYKRVSDAR